MSVARSDSGTVRWQAERASCMVLCATVGLVACTTQIQIHASRPADRRAAAELWSRARPGAICSMASAADACPGPLGRYTSSKSNDRVQPRLHASRIRTTRVEREIPARSATEVTASRISGGSAITSRRSTTSPNGTPPARRRRIRSCRRGSGERPDLHGLDAKDPWSYYRNPFVGTAK
jgi:hypothetical protein